MTFRQAASSNSKSLFRASRWLAGLAFLALLAGPRAAGADVSIPPVARVTDLTGTLSTEQQRTLSGRLAGFEQDKGSQLAVLILPSTKPETIEQYGIRLAEAWKLGRKGVDDGVILIVAKNDHRLRIEVGYGLEGAIPDAVASRIIDEAITPHFKAGDFYAGVGAGVDRIIRAAQGETVESAQPDTGQDAADDAAAEQAAREQLAAQRAEFDEAQKQLDAIQKDQSQTLSLIAGFFAVLLVSILGIAVFVGVRKRRSGGGGSSGSGSGSTSSSSSDSSSSSSDSDFSGGGGGFGGGGSSGSW